MVRDRSARGDPLESIAQFDKAHGKPGAAAVAQKARGEIEDAIAHDTKVALSGAKGKNDTVTDTVTWNVDNGGDFNGSMSPSEVQADRWAFAEWGSATGLNFVEVALTDAAGISVGMGAAIRRIPVLSALRRSGKKEGKFNPAPPC